MEKKIENEMETCEYGELRRFSGLREAWEIGQQRQALVEYDCAQFLMVPPGGGGGVRKHMWGII